MTRPRRKSSQRLAPLHNAQDAARIDAHVVPRYASLFARMLFSQINAKQRQQVLDLGCGTGHTSLTLLRTLPEGSRVIGIDPDPILIDHARLRAGDASGRGVFFQVASAESLKFGDGVFDLVIGNLALAAFNAPEVALEEARRVLAPGGRVLLTIALEGSFEETFDMFREVALKRDDPDLAARVERIAGRYPKASVLEAMASGLGLRDVEVLTETLQIPFGRALEIPTDPMIHYVLLPELAWIAGKAEAGEQAMTQAFGALDTYFGHGPVSLSVQAGLLTGRV